MFDFLKEGTGSHPESEPTAEEALRFRVEDLVTKTRELIQASGLLLMKVIHV